jgi:hypothetical protein
MTDDERSSAPQPGTDAVTTGAISGTGTGGLGSVAGTDSTPTVESHAPELDRPDPTASPLDELAERGAPDED